MAKPKSANEKPKRGGLGRGIGALIPQGKSETADAYFAGEDASTSGLGAGGDKTPPRTKRVSGAKPATTAGTATGTLGVPSSASASPSPKRRPSKVGVATPGSGATSDADLQPIPGIRLLEIDPRRISPNPSQPRKIFEANSFAELVHSVREFGVLQPIVVRPKGKDFELIMGERRLRASIKAGLDVIPAVVRDTADEAMLRDALLENLHRSNLNPLEEASAYQQLLDDFGITQEALADRLGRSRPQITNTIRLLKLPIEVQAKVASGLLSAGHARALLAASDGRVIAELADKVVREGLSVRSLEELVVGYRPAAKKGKIKPGGRVDMLNEVAERLSDQLDTRVRVTLGRTKGQLIIEFSNVADLKRITDIIEP